jgi:endonuclease/exonuclease/phosphatase family metal-dependent hydrolase
VVSDEPLSARGFDPTRLRVLSYNVRSLRDGAERVAAVIRQCAPDVVCVQEAPRFLRWRAKAARLATSCGLYVVTGGARAAGNLILADLRVRVVRSRDVLFTRTPGLHRRGVALAVLEVAGVRVAVAGTHFSLDAAERIRQASTVLGQLRRLAAPHAVLCGDINESPAGPAWYMLLAELCDTYPSAPWGGEHTSPAADPRDRIDAVFASPDIHVLRAGVPLDVRGLGSASDHRPVLAELKLPGAHGHADT